MNASVNLPEKIRITGKKHGPLEERNLEFTDKIDSAI